MNSNIKSKSRRRTPWTDVKDATPVQGFIEECTRRDYEAKHPALKGSPEVGLINSASPAVCRHCGSADIKRKGFTSNGIQRYVCHGCGGSFTPVTGTIFDSHRIPVTEWMDFLLDIFDYASFRLTSKANRNSYNTTKYWMDKVFLVLEGCQDDVMLSGKVWIDEKFYRARASEMQVKPDGTKYRGLSRNQLCIGIGCDEEGHVVCILEGEGKTNKAKTLAAFGGHIRKGSHLIHDMESCHDVLVERLGLESTTYNSRELKGVPDDENPLNPVNRICFQLEKFLNAHSGFLREDLHHYLDLFSFISNAPEDKYMKLEIFLKRALDNPKILRYRR